MDDESDLMEIYHSGVFGLLWMINIHEGYMKEKNINERNISFDLLRILAALGVVCIHSTIYYWKDYKPNSLEFLIFNIFNCLGRCSVPLFFMISGAFLLQRESNQKYVFRKVGRLLFIYVIWSALYAFSELGNAIFNFQFSQWMHYFADAKFHLWFLPVMICIYIILPILYAVVHYENGKYLHYAMSLFVVFGICKSTLIVLFPQNIYLSTILGKFHVELCEYTGYFLLGYYLLINGRKIAKLYWALIVYVAVVTFTVIATQIASVNQQGINNIFNSYFSFPVFCEAVCVFILFRDSNIVSKCSLRVSKTVVYVAETSLGIYLLHPFVMERLDSVLGVNAKMCTPILSLPIVAVLSFSISLITISVLKKIPLLKKIC